MRRLTTVLLTALLSVLLSSPVGATHRYPDVPDAGVFAREIAWADANELIAGYADGKFRPGAAVARIEAVIVLFNYAVALDAYDGPEVPPFPATATLADVRAWANANEIWGSEANRTRPATRAQVVRYLSRYHTRVDGGTLTGDAMFSDTGGTAYADEIAWAASSGVVDGFADGTFRPNELVTRGQLVAIVHRYQVAFDGGTPFDEPDPDPVPSPRPEPTPAPTPTPGCSPAYVECLPADRDVNCSEIRMLVHLVDPGVDPYRLDRDGNGIGCESYG